jgi:malate dehydrogenase (oxaloacetate-decarboxylating)
VNNALVFPGLFRGALDAHVTSFDAAVLLACAQALADLAPLPRADRLLPDVLDRRIMPAIAAAVTQTASGRLTQSGEPQ